MDSDRVSRARSYSGAKPYLVVCRIRDFHPLWPPIPERSARILEQLCLVLQPHSDESEWFRLIRVRSPLLTESRFLSFPGGTEMFQFPPFATYTYGFSVRQFGNPGINTRLTVSPGLSQSSTPFIASWRQDIPHMPLIAWPHCSCPPARGSPPLTGHVAMAPENKIVAKTHPHDPVKGRAVSFDPVLF